VVGGEQKGQACTASSAYFESADAVAEFLKTAGPKGLSVISDSSRRLPPKAQAGNLVYADLSGMARVLALEAADQTARVETGLKVRQLNLLLKESNLWWPVSASPEATVLDVIASGEGGPLEHGYGGPRDLVLGLSLALVNGKVIKCGGKVVKNVSGYDLTRLMVGARSWLAVATSANLRLYALPHLRQTSCFIFSGAKAVLQAARSVLRSGLPLAALEVVNGNFLIQAANLNILADKLGTPDDVILAAQIEGMKSVVCEVEGALRKIVGARAEAVILDASSQDRLWQAISDGVDTAENGTVELCMPAAQLFEMLAASKVKYALSAQPGRGRANISVAPGSLATLFEVAQSYALSAAAKPMTLAYADDKFNFRLRRLPKNGEAMAALLGRLKNEYDPEGVLNPFVTFLEED
jgi:D-lactate dehydrogenase (cytochrome)